MMGLYEIRNSVTEEVYIGSAKVISRRFAGHQCLLRKGTHHNPKLQNSWNKYGAAAFSFTMLEPVELIDDLYIREQAALDRLHPEFNLNFVVTAPQTLGKHRSQVTKDKIRAGHLGRVNGPPSSETRAKISAANRGRKLSDEHRAKLSVAKLGKHRGPYASKLCETDVERIRDLYANKVRIDTIARYFRVSRLTINDIINGKTWRIQS